MEVDEAVRIVKEIQEKRIFKVGEVKSYLNSNNLVKSKEDMMQIIHAVVNQNALFPEFVQGQLADCASESDEYYNLIVALAKNPQNSYSLVSLIELYKKDDKIALWLINKLNQLDDESVAVPLGYLYGGMGKEEPDKLFCMINQKLTPTQKIAYSIAINVASVETSIPRKIIDFIISLSESDVTSIRRSAINSLSWALISIPKVQKHLLNLAKNGDGQTKLILVGYVFPNYRKKKDFVFSILKECSKTRDNQVRKEVSICLASFASEYPLDCIKITKRWSKDSKFLYGSHENWFLEEIGKGKLDKIYKFMESWVHNEKDINIKIIALPHIMARVYQADDKRLIKLLKTIDYKNKTMDILIRSTLKKFLSEAYGNVRPSPEFYKECEKILLQIAKHRKLNVKPDPQWTNPLIRTLAMIREIETKKKNPSVKDAKKNLKHFKNLVRVLKKNKLEKIICDQSSHQLVNFLSRAFVSKSVVNKKLKEIENEKFPWKKQVRIDSLIGEYYPFAILADMDASLSLFKDNDQGMQRIKRGLLEENEFFETLTELNISARLKKKYPVTLQPPIGKKNVLDIQALIENKEVLFEIFKPKGDIRLEYVETVHGIANVIRDKIVKKIDEQIKYALDSKLPVVLIIDKTDAHEIDDLQIIDTLFGTMQITMRFDKKSKKVVDEFPSRATDSIYRKSKNAHVLSAVMLVRRYYDHTDMKVKLSGELFPAPRPAIPLGKKSGEVIKKAVFGTAMF